MKSYFDDHESSIMPTDTEFDVLFGKTPSLSGSDA